MYLEEIEDSWGIRCCGLKVFHTAKLLFPFGFVRLLLFFQSRSDNNLHYNNQKSVREETSFGIKTCEA